MEFIQQKNPKGMMSISENVIRQIAENSINEAQEHELKDFVFSKCGKKTGKIIAQIDKNSAKVTLEIFIKTGKSAADGSALIQKIVSDEIKKRVDLKSLKVNVVVLGFVK